MIIKIGDRVRLTEDAKYRIADNSPQHILEFGGCVGVVECQTDYNNYGKANDRNEPYDPKKVGPEFDVRWEPSGLRYAYRPDDLEKVPPRGPGTWNVE